MSSKKLESIINIAIKKANELKHEYLTLEILLWALLQDEHSQEILKDCGADVVEINNELEEFLQNPTNFSILSDGEIDILSREQFVDDELRKLAADSGISYQPEISIFFETLKVGYQFLT